MDELKVNENDTLHNGDKLILVQIGKRVFTLKLFGSMDIGNIDAMTEKYDVRFLKEK